MQTQGPPKKYEKENITLQNPEGENCLMTASSLEDLEATIKIAINFGKLKKILKQTTKEEDNVVQFFIKKGKLDYLKKLLDVVLLNLSQIRLKNPFGFFEDIIFKLKFHSWQHHEANTICNEIISNLQKARRNYSPLDKETCLKKCQSELRYDLNAICIYLFNKNQNEVDSLQIAFAQTIVLLFNPKQCFVYLQKLNDEIVKYYEELHPNETFPQLNREQISFENLNDLTFPLVDDNYSGISKNSVLQKYLINFFKKYDMGKQLFTLLNFVHPVLAKTLFGSGSFVTESRLGQGLFHGKLSHMLQQYIVISAILDGKINLPSNVLIRDFFDLTTSQTTYDNKAIRLPLFDRRAINRIHFSDPFRLSSILMYIGPEMKCRALSDCLTDSFCKGLQKYLKTFNKIFNLKLTSRQLYQELGDINLSYFYHSLEDILFKEALKNYSKTKGNKHKTSTLFARGEDFAVMEKIYHTLSEDNKEKEPEKKSKKRKSSFEGKNQKKLTKF